MKISVKLFILIILLNVMCVSCTYISTKSITSAFSISAQQILNNMETIVKFQHVDINGIETIKNGISNKVLLVKLVNPDITSDTDDTIYILSKKIAQQLKSELKDSTTFNSYKILFTYKGNRNGLSITSYKGQIISSRDL